ncbi:MAG: SagB/ThcOx family dehydrogenase [Negativicutes bacterium]|nr:SagB/ThcOx family dehydrogenase [Negativicutes bacterium]
MKSMAKALVLLSFVLMMTLVMNTASAQDFTTIKLSPPETDKGKPLMQVFQERQSGREFANRNLELQDLSNLLWAAYGINRQDGKHTAPSARNVQEYEIYVIMEQGVYVYEPKNHELVPVVEGDYRGSAGSQAYVATAPVDLMYVADLSKISWMPDMNGKLSIAYIDVGFIAENAALFCASEGLVSVPRLNMDTAKLAQIMRLSPDQKVILSTSVGYPK